MPRILVVDDDPKITSLLRRALTFAGFDVATAGGGQEGLLQWRSAQPDLVILDVMMPGMDGFAVCRQIRRESDVPILLLTARDEVSDRVEGLDLGADDYLVKPFALEELLARVRAVLRRRGPAQVLRYGDLVMDLAERRASYAGRPLELTAKEFELLALLMQHPRRVLTHDTIMERVWGYDFGGESNVLAVYVRYLRQKLAEAGAPPLVQTVRGVGYVLRA